MAIMESFENGRLLALENPTNITQEFKTAITTYCHFDYYKSRGECNICYGFALIHNCCDKCTMKMCEKCLLEINKNMDTNICPQCRFKYSLQFFTNKINDNRTCIYAHYSANMYNKYISQQPICYVNNNFAYGFVLIYNYMGNMCELKPVKPEDDMLNSIELPLMVVPLADQMRLCDSVWWLCKKLEIVPTATARRNIWNKKCEDIMAVWYA